MLTVDAFFPDVAPKTWTDNQDWLAPDFWRPTDDAHPVALQSWLVRSEGKNIFTDTGGGNGNGKSRPSNPAFDHLDTQFLEQLAPPVCNPTTSTWSSTPTCTSTTSGGTPSRTTGSGCHSFPNATYLLPEQDLAYFETAGTDPARRRHIDDSIVPVLEARQARTFADSYRIDDHLTLEGAPGHTPGSSVVQLHSGTDQAVFVGDVLHNPVRVIQPNANSCFCLDPAVARTTRRRLLSWAADNPALVLPAHFGGAGASEVTRQGNAFQVKRWAPFTAPPPI